VARGFRIRVMITVLFGFTPASFRSGSAVSHSTISRRDILSHVKVDHTEAIRFLPLSAQVFHILLALSDGDHHGYGIMQDVEDRTSGKLRLSAGTLYGSIKRMLEQGLIVELQQRDRFSKNDDTIV